MKVRALPTCRKPVGEGAKRTRSGDVLAEVDIRVRANFDGTVGAPERQAGEPNRFCAQPL